MDYAAPVWIDDCVKTVNQSLRNFTENCNVSGQSSSTEYILPDPPYPPWATGLLAFMAGVTSLWTTLGNIMVVAVFMLEKNLRQPSNYLIASLAITDILIGMFSMPFYSLYLLMKYWPLGQLICDLWLSLDYTVCLVSQYTVFLITLDRFCSVKAPAKYRNWRTKRKIKIMIAIIWIVPTFLFFSSILGWRKVTGIEPPTDYTCDAEFQKDPLFTVILVISYYWITLVIMIGLYIGIYRVALNLHSKSKAKSQRMQQLKHLSAGTINNNHSKAHTKGSAVTNGKATSLMRAAKVPKCQDEISDYSNEPSSSDSNFSHKNDLEITGMTTLVEQTPESEQPDSPIWKPRGSLPSGSIRWNDAFGANNTLQQAEACKLLNTEGYEFQQQQISVAANGTEHQPSKNRVLAEITKLCTQIRVSKRCKGSSPSNSPKIKSKSANRARKALRTISFILGAFVLCWTPYHVVVIVYSFCDCVNLTFYEFTYWLCYMNSPLNPFCYALSNQQFKRGFIKIYRGEYFRRRNRTTCCK